MQKLYFECLAGVSGDMTVAALLDLGADEHKLRQALASLPVEGYTIEITRVKKSGLDACDFHVILDAEHENHDHDMEYLYGHLHGGTTFAHEHAHPHDHEHHHAHGHEHEHPHDHDHEHEHRHDHGHEHEHHHAHRSLADIRKIIEDSAIPDGAKAIATRVFTILGKAESKAHGVPMEDVHFHEVGAVDSIVDIVAAAICLDDLGISDVIVSPLAEGCGTVRCQHGILPIPVPAVTNILTEHALSIRQTAIPGELITPTGAALMAAVGTEDNLPENYTITAVGLGAGKREYETSGIVRAMILDA